jgi:putative colanic acid biosynthesis UDP-glucose lipid carrier transferase
MKIEKDSMLNISTENRTIHKMDKGLVDKPVGKDYAYRINLLPYRLIKRGIDVILSLFVICFIFPWLMPILSILIIIDLGFPVFFIQDRIGLNNRRFRCFKLRTMGPATNVSRNRVSGFGNFLRVYKLDEIPQFFNVLKGDMSVVGPRPHTLNDHHIFRKLIGEKYDLRHNVKPGITGLAQINGYEGKINSLTKLQGRVFLDLHYIRNWSVKLENKIIYRTLGVILKGPHRIRRAIDASFTKEFVKKEKLNGHINLKNKRKIINELLRDG